MSQEKGKNVLNSHKYAGVAEVINAINASGYKFDIDTIINDDGEEVIMLTSTDTRRGGIFSFSGQDREFVGYEMSLNVVLNWEKEGFNQEDIGNNAPCWFRIKCPEDFVLQMTTVNKFINRED